VATLCENRFAPRSANAFSVLLVRMLDAVQYPPAKRYNSMFVLVVRVFHTHSHFAISSIFPEIRKSAEETILPFSF